MANRKPQKRKRSTTASSRAPNKRSKKNTPVSSPPSESASAPASNATQLPPDATFPFLSLPPEIRLMIYGHILGDQTYKIPFISTAPKTTPEKKTPWHQPKPLGHPAREPPNPRRSRQAPLPTQPLRTRLPPLYPNPAFVQSPAFLHNLHHEIRRHYHSLLRVTVLSGCEYPPDSYWEMEVWGMKIMSVLVSQLPEAELDLRIVTREAIERVAKNSRELREAVARYGDMLRGEERKKVWRVWLKTLVDLMGVERPKMPEPRRI
ncbi:unnamed protein product [Periconia digitata]|uniref:Uncharacterized protein n=1 Tax=Periconia digitata TaxID=1303443 RepID=A0A9W4XR64_9PLEO|nr:unnamed protein product [Periconia digitata]